jgi:threonine aldolase
MIDLRSDTITQPTEAMRRAMAQAELGDDYYGEDPTVCRLESLAAEMLGKEAGLFVTSGTMGNLVSVMTHTQRGDAIAVEENSHIYLNENGGVAAIAGVLPHPVRGHLGVMAPEQIETALLSDEVLHSRNRLICVENTHNVAGGTCWTVEDMQAVRAMADEHDMALHVDGARIFNAAVALGVEAEQLAADADSLTFCLSKGLSCPYGSLIVGSKDFIAEARRNRQMLGGGMRQAGVMAAAGIVALETMVDRLAEDHENARLLAEGLQELGCTLDLETVQTNMVFFQAPPGRLSQDAFVRKLGDAGVWVNRPRGERVRMVTHYGIIRDDIQETLRAVRRVLSR